MSRETPGVSQRHDALIRREVEASDAGQSPLCYLNIDVLMVESWHCGPDLVGILLIVWASWVVVLIYVL